MLAAITIRSVYCDIYSFKFSVSFPFFLLPIFKFSQSFWLELLSDRASSALKVIISKIDKEVDQYLKPEILYTQLALLESIIIQAKELDDQCHLPYEEKRLV